MSEYRPFHKWSPAERREFKEKMSKSRKFSGPAWAVYMGGNFHVGVFFTRADADAARLAEIDKFSGYAEYNGIVGRRHWQIVIKVARVSVVATPTHWGSP